MVFSSLRRKNTAIRQGQVGSVHRTSVSYAARRDITPRNRHERSGGLTGRQDLVYFQPCFSETKHLHSNVTRLLSPTFSSGGGIPCKCLRVRSRCSGRQRIIGPCGWGSGSSCSASSCLLFAAGKADILTKVAVKQAADWTVLTPVFAHLAISWPWYLLLFAAFAAVFTVSGSLSGLSASAFW